MFTKKSLFSILTVLLVTNFALNGHQVLADDSFVNVFVSPSTAYVGEEVTLTCDVDKDFTWQDDYYLLMSADYLFNFAKFSLKHSANGSRSTIFRQLKEQKNIDFLVSSVTPVEQDHHLKGDPVSFQLKIVPKFLHIFDNIRFYCQICIWPCYPNSKPAPLKVLPLPPVPPQPKLVTSIAPGSSAKLDTPFTLSCTVPKQFTASNRAYSVGFYSSRDGLMADYEVDMSGQALFFYQKHPEVLVNQGVIHSNASLPRTFELKVTERSNPNLEYWCLLTDFTGQSNASAQVGTPLLHFSSSNASGAQNLTHQGCCTVANSIAQYIDRAIMVEFYSDLGEDETTESLLGYYLIKPNQLPEFAARTGVPHWASIAHGTEHSFPHFDITATLEDGSINLASGHKWWCTVSFQEAERGTLQRFKSNMANF